MKRVSKGGVRERAKDSAGGKGSAVSGICERWK